MPEWGNALREAGRRIGSSISKLGPRDFNVDEIWRGVSGREAAARRLGLLGTGAGIGLGVGAAAGAGGAYLATRPSADQHSMDLLGHRMTWE